MDIYYSKIRKKILLKKRLSEGSITLSGKSKHRKIQLRKFPNIRDEKKDLLKKEELLERDREKRFHIREPATERP